MDKNILGNNSTTRILLDMGFAMESQELKNFHFALLLGKTNDWIYKKKYAKYSIFGHFLPKFGQK